jgi:ADP-heptose:LPS heptosyltransferase
MSKERIVVVRQLGGVGDVLMMSPVYLGLREKFPRATIQLITGREYLSAALTDIAERNPYIDEVHIIEPHSGTTRKSVEVLARFFQNMPEHAYIDDNPMLTRATEWHDLNWICAWTEGTQLHQGAITTPRYKIWCDFAGVSPSSYKPIYRLTKDDKQYANDIWSQRGWHGKKVVGIGVAASDARRSLPVESARKIAFMLRDRGYVPVVINPTLSFPDDGIAGINGMRFSQVMSCIGKMSAVVSPDTGVLHMAGALDVPVVGVFGPTDHLMRMEHYRGSAVDSRVLAPCAPCWYKYGCLKDPNPSLHYACMKRLPLESIVREVERWIP